MIAVIDGTISATSKKWLDIEIPNRWPLIALTDPFFLLSPSGEATEFAGFDHLSIPPDLRLHVSGSRKRQFFDARPAWMVRDSPKPTYLHWFSFIGTTVEKSAFLSGGRPRKWHQVMLVSPKPDAEFIPVNTRVFVDFFLHVGNLPAGLDKIPPALPNMRLAYDANGCGYGPFALTQLYRKGRPAEHLLFSIRFGFTELAHDRGVFLYVPSGTYQHA